MRALLAAVAVVIAPLLGLPLLDAAAGPPPNGLPQHPDIPPVAMEAYVGASSSAPSGCVMPWWVLAGIGKVESDHGRFGGRTLTADGTPSTPIIGIRLDGSHNTAVITDTDGGVLDGDPFYDRAVGPMQFIPSTWSAFVRDGDADGRANPHDIHDAAAAAAAYLCSAVPGDFGDPDHSTTAIRAYNNSAAYVAEVLRQATRYRDEATLSSADVGPHVDGHVCPVAGPVTFIDSWGFPRSGGRTHKGQDLFAASGTSLVAMTDADVVEVSSGSRLGGNVVWLRSDDGAHWYYAHLRSFAPGLAAGRRVSRGELIGSVGNTGNARSTPPHLHIQWRPGGRRAADVNPYPLLDAACPEH